MNNKLTAALATFLSTSFLLTSCGQKEASSNEKVNVLKVKGELMEF
ncbi:hypothetical protein WAX78_23710 [Bacillus sp. FJAT-53711]|uniref:Uncharacterized protein n=1 Tax=Bacillus yunxiaonensis TaxID=3127665 RepID=A0ABU8G2G7_9BACI